MFEKIEGAKILTTKAGVFKECDVYTLDKELYVKMGSGYLRIEPWGRTSGKGVRWKDGALDCQPLMKGVGSKMLWAGKHA